MSSLPIIDKFLQSVVVLSVSIGYQKGTGLLVRVETNFPDPTIYLPASGRRSAVKVTPRMHVRKAFYNLLTTAFSLCSLDDGVCVVSSSIVF